MLCLGTEKADVVNCKTGGTLEKMDIGTFWRGFESVKGNNVMTAFNTKPSYSQTIFIFASSPDRPLDNKGEPTLLKLKVGLTWEEYSRILVYYLNCTNIL